MQVQVFTRRVFQIYYSLYFMLPSGWEKRQLYACLDGDKIVYTDTRISEDCVPASSTIHTRQGSRQYYRILIPLPIARKLGITKGSILLVENHGDKLVVRKIV